jgi:RNA polymerase sigma-70 factor (ECF subfamily)
VQRELVERAQRGDRDAFSTLAAASIARLYNLAQLMLGDADRAEDAVQETLVAAWRDLRGLRDPDRYEAWIHRILVRSVYREGRRGRRSTTADHEPPGPDWAGTTIRSGTAEVEDRDELDRCFLRLTSEHRAVLVLRHYVGLPDGEAADLLGIPAGTFKSRLNRATAALRAELDADARRGLAIDPGAVR